jgi:hypothetical protein
MAAAPVLATAALFISLSTTDSFFSEHALMQIIRVKQIQNWLKRLINMFLDKVENVAQTHSVWFLVTIC